MKRLPLLPTLLVALAVVTMLCLGVWQLQRKAEKEALLARLAANRSMPAISIVSEEMRYVKDENRYRPVFGNCVRVVEWRVEGGRASNEEPGYRHLATCVSKPSSLGSASGFVVDLGVSKSPIFRPAWRGGKVFGWLSTVPQHYSVIEKAIGKIPVPEPLLVSYSSPAGLVPTWQPANATISNNHLFYALQWFFFAGAAAVIYLLALRRRSR